MKTNIILLATLVVLTVYGTVGCAARVDTPIIDVGSAVDVD